MLTCGPSCASLLAIRPFVCEKKRFAQFTDRQTDGRTDDGRRCESVNRHNSAVCARLQNLQNAVSGIFIPT